MSGKTRFMIVCLTSKAEGGERDGYVLAAGGRLFDDFDEAVEYAKTIAQSREPLVLAQAWPNGEDSGDRD